MMIYDNCLIIDNGNGYYTFDQISSMRKAQFKKFPKSARVFVYISSCISKCLHQWIDLLAKKLRESKKFLNLHIMRSYQFGQEKITAIMVYQKQIKKPEAKG